jgi:hypothetical protein
MALSHLEIFYDVHINDLKQHSSIGWVHSTPRSSDLAEPFKIINHSAARKSRFALSLVGNKMALPQLIIFHIVHIIMI